MFDQSVEQLNREFGIQHHVQFSAGQGGFPMAAIRNEMASAVIFTHGAQITHFEPHGQKPVLWLSPKAEHLPGKAIRGGIPICWPWFGKHPDPAKPSHGFARILPWRVHHAKSEERVTQIEFILKDGDQTRKYWPHGFELKLDVAVGRELRVTLNVRNTGTNPFTCSGALHSYFSVGDVEKVHIHGLENTPYVDQLDGKTKPQQGPLTIGGEVDRLYQNTTHVCTIEDPSLHRKINITKQGSKSTVVWNPWAEKTKQLADMEPDAFRRMVCVETANAGADQIAVRPGQVHHLAAVIAVE